MITVGSADAKKRLVNVAGMLLSDSPAEAHNALTVLRQTMQAAGITSGDFKERFAVLLDKDGGGTKLSMTREELADFIIRGVEQNRAKESNDIAYSRLKRQRDAAVRNMRLTLGALAAVLLDAWSVQNDVSNYLWLGAILVVWCVFYQHKA